MVEVVVCRPARQFSEYDGRWDDLVAVAAGGFEMALVVRAPATALATG